MAACDPFDVTINGDVAAKMQQVKAQVEAGGGTFNGDEHAGTITGSVPVLGSIEVTYTVAGQTATVTVQDKPFFVSCDTIESRVREYFQ